MIVARSLCKSVFLVAISLLLTACTDDRGIQDLEQFVAEQKSIKPPEIEPLPVIEPADSYAYAAASEGNPFSISNVIPDVKVMPKAEPLVMKLDRDREILEYFPIDSLKMVGTLNQGGALWAMVVAPDDTIHRN
jgi:type IV pilus assembly protein PilP